MIAQLVTDPAAWGAFLTGVASVLGAVVSLRRTRKRAEDQCEQRIKDIKQAFETGTQFQRRRASR